jgi:hypothetical protein
MIQTEYKVMSKENKNYNREEFERLLFKIRDLCEEITEHSIDVTKAELQGYVKQYVEYLWEDIEPFSCDFPEESFDRMLKECCIERASLD